jgi:hypothetical protein
MNRQKSFENEKPTLYLVPTPIGNLNEMTPRAIDVLNSVDVIACEDTRNSGQLLKHFGISKRLIAYQNFNEASSTKGIINLLSQGNNVALISDAGYPLINDPGQRVVSEVTALGYNVVPISGCSAFLNALVASGLIAQPFIFIGFLPPSTHECVKKLRLYQSYPMTLIMYEAPHRIEKMLQSCLDVLGDRHICIARELTKVHEEFIRGTISEILPIASELKGEMVVVIEGNQDDYEKDIDMGQILNMVNTSIESGMSTSAAIKEVAKQTGISKNQIYDLVHGKTDQKGVC